MSTNYFLFVLLVLPVTSLLASDELCQQGDNCKLPNCRCWSAKNAPGSIEPENTPQMVLVSFNRAINIANVDNYTALFTGIKNPNKCPTLGTFFVQEQYTSPSSVQQLAKQGHEIGVTSEAGVIPEDWTTSFNDTKTFLEDGAKIDPSKITGCRAPNIFVGGDKQMSAMEATGLVYDSSCVSMQYMDAAQMLWPYTYDFISSTPVCTLGDTPSKPHPGVWQFLRPVLMFNKTRMCTTPAACSPYFKTSKDVYQFLVNNYIKHLNGRRTPFQLEISPEWLANPIQREGSRTFLQYVSSGFQDTWIITHHQALEWIKNPVNASESLNFKPWSC